MFKNRLFAIIMAMIMVLSLTMSGCGSSDTNGIEEEETGLSEAELQQILSTMSLEDKVAQRLMIDISQWESGPDINAASAQSSVLSDAQRSLFTDYNLGGVILFAGNYVNKYQFRSLTDDIKATNAMGGDQLDMFIATDQEGGSITRLETGTRMTGNMALAATGNPENATAAAQVLASELSATGVNVGFAPVLDVNCNPANPVIGLRSFSSDPNTVAEYGEAFIEGFHSRGIISSVKHFPGHGDTTSDSHTGMPCVDKSLKEIRSMELLPFSECAEEADMVMTAHITYPQIESDMSPSKSTGEPIYLPATLSDDIITGILRNDMGYDGVVITDAMNMEAITKNFDLLDATKFAMNAGVDIILMPMSVNNNSDRKRFDEYFNSVVEMVANGDISAEELDASVMRILKLKNKYGLIRTEDVIPIQAVEGQDDTDVEEAQGEVLSDAEGSSDLAEPTIEDLLASVGGQEHREIEMQVARECVTLLQNNGAFPFDGQDGKTTVFFAFKDDQVNAVNYAVEKMKYAGLVPEDFNYKVINASGHSAGDYRNTIGNADRIVALGRMEYTSDMNPGSGKGAFISGAIKIAHEEGIPAILLSTGLPYEAAVHKDADAILLCYNTLGVLQTPVYGEEYLGYGPNIIVSIESIFGSFTPTGKCPVTIPEVEIDGGKVTFTDKAAF